MLYLVKYTLLSFLRQHQLGSLVKEHFLNIGYVKQCYWYFTMNTVIFE